MKKLLTDLLEKRQKELQEIEKRFDDSENVDEVKSLGAKLQEVKNEIAEIEQKLKELENQEENQEAVPEKTEENKQEEKQEERSLNPLATYGKERIEVRKMKKEENRKDTIEYRQAFKDYIQKGIKSDILEFRDDAVTTTTNMGVLFPTVIEKEIIGSLDKYYSLYNQVRHLAIPAGVKFPLATLNPTVSRIAEGTGSARQQVTVSGAVEFGLRYMEVKVAVSFLVTLVDVEEFERAIVDAMAQAIAKQIDSEIISGRGPETYDEFTGLITEANKVSGRIQAGQIISMSGTDFTDWKKWSSKVFGKLPIAMSGNNAKWLMTNSTFESLKALSDDNNRPIVTDWFNIQDGSPIKKFYGHDVILIEDDTGINSVYLKSIENASANDFVAILIDLEKGYAINQPEPLTTIKYRDEDTNQDVLKNLLCIDGNILNSNYIYYVKKSS